MIKNYTSTDSRVLDKIQKCLIEHKATRIMFDYEGGLVAALTFSMMVGSREVPFRLPARWKNVEQIFLEKKKKTSRMYNVTLTEAQKEQAYRTAWANIKDWIEAQMALIDTDQVKFEEVFLPYAVANDGKTYFEKAQESKYFLGSGNTDDEQNRR